MISRLFLVHLILISVHSSEELDFGTSISERISGTKVYQMPLKEKHVLLLSMQVQSEGQTVRIQIDDKIDQDIVESGRRYFKVIDSK